MVLWSLFAEERPDFPPGQLLNRNSTIFYLAEDDRATIDQSN